MSIAQEKGMIGVVGATGLVGSEILRILEERGVTAQQLSLFASSDSAGELYSFGGEELEVRELSHEGLAEMDFALFAVNATIAERFIPRAKEAGVIVIDSSERYRLDDSVPLVVPEVNGELLSSSPALISSPSSLTAQLLPVLAVLHRKAPLKRVVASTYQAVSGAGKAAMDELWEQTRAVFTQQPIEFEEFQYQIAFNCIPQVDLFLEDGYTKEEARVVDESRKVLDIPGLPITVTAVRVPVFHGHAESVNVEFDAPISVDEAVALLSAQPGIEIASHPEDLPLQTDIATKDSIAVGRVRRDPTVPSGLHLWIVADNLRKGAALNVVQILERLVECRSDQNASAPS
ncbi:aspartate-semialdehyde dehydrogenase [bacterium]|nr:aspartate-semialdehyde dehydrogenase [bacterium]